MIEVEDEFPDAVTEDDEDEEDEMAVNRPNFGSLTYVALKPMKIGNSVRAVGAAVPEAAHWRNLTNYINAGYIAIVGAKSVVPLAKQRVTKKKGNAATRAAEYTHYAPTDPNGAQSSVAVDSL